MKKKIVSILLSSVLMVGLLPICANAEWRKDNTGWWFTEGNSYVKDGWKLINNKWYYFDKNGYMKTGWINDNGTWYYLLKNGDMLSNAITPDGYTLNVDGSWNVSIPRTDNKAIASTPSIDTSNNSTTNEINENNNNTENTSDATTTKKKKSSSSSSSSKGGSTTTNNRFDYVYVYYSEGGVIQIIRSNEEPPEANNTLPFVKINPKEYGYNNYFDFLKDKNLSEYMIKDGKFVKKNDVVDESIDDKIIENDTKTTTSESIKFN